ncbi:FUSC family protein [Streptomyces sp. CT34]|uniref:FUSC family protein n=1 Tax=Streptomyces sp. CT34 TaxID=1553907 RepID=UPI00099BE579|nr:FUSC family protein [Streptomyces sp. CT34]
MGKHAKPAAITRKLRKDPRNPEGPKNAKKPTDPTNGENPENRENGSGSSETGLSGPVRVRPLPVRSTVRLRRPVDIWHKPALSAVVALAVPDLTLFALGRLDLVLYTSAGAMCALYAHGLPYAARARTLLWVVLGMVASLAVALTAASLVASAAVLVVLASLVAAVHKMVCDATRIGPPGNLILTFIAASAFFVPQRAAEVPKHLGLALGAGAFAWLVCMAPALVRPRGPERIATARALEAAAGLLRTRAGAAGDGAARTGTARGSDPVGVAQARHATAAAVNAAWHTLFLVPVRTAQKAAARAELERLLAQAESALGDADPPGGAEAAAERFGGWARELRSGRPVPDVPLSAAQAEELAGVAAEAGIGRHADALPAAPPSGGLLAAPPSRGRLARPSAGLRRPVPGRPRGVRAVLARLAPGSPLLPIGARVAVGCVLAGWASMAVGVGHPYWAVVTAASIYQANTTLSWQRAVQRTLGNLLGLVLFTALLPLIHTGRFTMVALALAFQLGAEATISRNYWLGSVCVTPMALLLTEFGRHLPASTLIADRWIDTVVGAAVGLACCVLVTNRRAADRIDSALERLAEAEAAASRLLAAGPGARTVPGPGTSWASGPVADEAREAGWARDRLAGCLVELREAVDVAAGEWWQRALPEERIARAEQQGHRTLAGLVRRLSAPALAA